MGTLIKGTFFSSRRSGILERCFVTNVKLKGTNEPLTPTCEEAAIGQSLVAFFLGVRLLLATWPRCPGCAGAGGKEIHHVHGKYEDWYDLLCTVCRSTGGDPSWRSALERAGWKGPEVSR